MREILFRGKNIINGVWLEGQLIVDERGNCYIGEYIKQRVEIAYCYVKRRGGKTVNRFVGIGFAMVAPETIGQYTGVTDKNGKKIFDGDIVKHYNNSDDGFDIGVLYWDETFSQWKRTSIGNFHSRDFTYMMSRSCEYEVIGNVHDNPELLTEAETT